MSLTIAQASAVNVITDHLTGTSRHDRPTPSRREAIEALQTLVPQAYKALGAGWTPAELQAHLGFEGCCDACDRPVGSWPMRDCDTPEAHVDATFNCPCGRTLTVEQATDEQWKHRRCNEIGDQP